MRVLFDADSMVYGCGFAVQKTLYDWTATNGTEFVEEIFTSKADLDAAVALLPDGWTNTYSTVVEAEPLENALALCKRQLYGIEERLENQGLSFRRLELFLTGKGNFREEIATIRPYKGNRVLMEKPVHYNAIRRYLVNQRAAKVVHGREADDIVAIIAAYLKYDPAEVLIVSQDKDLRTVPGLLYNYRRKTFELITERDALVNFYKQIVVGDATDNIMGIYRAGEKLAKAITADMTEEEMYAYVLDLCEKSRSLKGCPYADRRAESVVLEFGQLLHLQRTEDDLWQPPGSRRNSSVPVSLDASSAK